MAVHLDRPDVRAARVERPARVVPRVAFVDGPAEVQYRPEPGTGDVVDLLPGALADVADVQVAGRPVEREAPRVAKPVVDELRLRAAFADVQLPDLRELRLERLAVVVRVAAGAAVAEPDVEQSVRAEGELAAVVVREGLALVEDLPRRGQDRGAPVRAILDDARVPGGVGVVDVEEMVPRVARMERDREQAPLAAARHARVDVEERLPAKLPAHDDGDHPALLDDVEPAGLARRRGQMGQPAEPADDHRRHCVPLRARGGHEQRRRDHQRQGPTR